MTTDILKTVNRFLISRQFAVWSLVLLALLLVVAGTLPDFSFLSEKEFAQLRESRPVLFWISSYLQISNLTRSPLFLILPGAIWLSTALCMIRRLRRELPQLRKKSVATEPAMPDATTISIDSPFAGVREKVREVLREQRWRFEEITKNGVIRYVGRKGRYGFWGSVVFHLSLLILLLGIIVSSLGRFDAEMVLAEGQTTTFTEEAMLRVNRKSLLSPSLSGIPITLRKFTADFAQDKYPVDYAAYLTVGTNAAREVTIRVNHPLMEGRHQIFLHRYGFAPRFEVWDSHGTLFFDAFVNLVISRPDQKDHFDLPHHGLRIETQLFPDYRMNGETAVSASPSPKNPVIRVRVFADGVSIGEEDLPIGQTADFGNYRLAFPELRYWAWFGVVYDPGYGLMIIGFIACVAGLALRFADSEKWMHVRVEQQADSVCVALAGRSRYYPALFESEIESIAGKLKA